MFLQYPSIDAEINAAITKHQDLRASIQIQQDILKSSYSKLQESQPEKEEHLAMHQKQKEELDQVGTLAADCENKWQDVNCKLHQCKDYLDFHLKLLEIVSWIDHSETLLKIETVETASADIASLIRKQTSFERSLQQQIKTFSGVKIDGEKLISQDNFKAEVVNSGLIEVEHDLQKLQEKNSGLILELTGLEKCKVIIRKINELRSWLKEKLHVALDESYLELTNILSKLQR